MEQLVTIRGKAYAWSREHGLDTEAVLTLTPWIIKQAKPYLPKARLLNVDLDDLVQAGSIGALYAARTYDPSHGRTYLSWATPRIKDAIGALCRRPIEQGIESDEIPTMADEQQDNALEVDLILSKLLKRDRKLLIAHYGINASGEVVIRTGMARNLNLAHYRAKRQLIMNTKPPIPSLKTKPFDPPTLPLVSFRPMTEQAKAELEAKLRSVKPELWRREVQDWVNTGYARLWIHIVLLGGYDPAKAINSNHAAYNAKITEFCRAVEWIGLHREVDVQYWATEVTRLAADLWKQAKVARARNNQPTPLPGLEPDQSYRRWTVSGGVK